MMLLQKKMFSFSCAEPEALLFGIIGNKKSFNQVKSIVASEMQILFLKLSLASEKVYKAFFSSLFRPL